MAVVSMFRKLQFLLLAVLLLWVKTYAVSKLFFHIKIENVTQELLLLFSPLSSILFVLGLSFLYKRVHPVCVLLLSSAMTCILYANIIFYGFFDDFLTLPVLFQKSNMGDLAASIQSLLHLHMLLLFVDLVLLIVIWRRYPQFARPVQLSRSEKGVYLLGTLLLLTGNLAAAESERPQLLTRSFDRELLVKNLGLFHYHIYDTILQTKSSAQRVLADGSTLSEVQNYVATRSAPYEKEMFGIAKGKNVILVSMESLQSFVLNSRIGGQEITPFLNEWGKHAYAFRNMYQQTGQGKTSDAEFLTETGLYPLDRGAVFFTHAGNTYAGAPAVLKQRGYYTAVFHANNKSFWNRDFMYPSLGYARYFHDADYTVTAANTTGWGLKDREFFDQSIQHLKSLPQPFYTKLITLTNHFPFQLPEQEQLLPDYPSASRTFSRYLQTVRYMDESLRYFVQRLKEEGLYDKSVLILYGDHYGISANHNRAVAAYLQKKQITPFEHIQLQRVPLFIHVPGRRGRTIETTVGQVDLKPTLLHLLGVETKDDLSFGRDMFLKHGQRLTVLRDGSFIADGRMYTANVCYEQATGALLAKEACQPYEEQAKKDLQYSDRIIYGDLLRFFKYQPKPANEKKL